MTDPVRVGPATVVIEAFDVRSEPAIPLFSYELPFEEGLDVQDFLERAFTYAQNADNKEPFVFSLRFYGYDYSRILGYPRTGFLGYEIESIGKGKVVLQSSSTAYWELFIDEQPASLGSDLLCPEPGAHVAWKFVPMTDNAPKSLRSTLARALPKP